MSEPVCLICVSMGKIYPGVCAPTVPVRLLSPILFLLLASVGLLGYTSTGLFPVPTSSKLSSWLASPQPQKTDSSTSYLQG